MPLPFPLPSSVIAMLLADARLPTGGHAHSAGLEPALQGGLAPEDAIGFLRGRALSVGRVDAGVAVVTRHLALVSNAERLADVERAWAARAPSAAQREAARVLGRGYLRVATRLWPDSALIQSAVGVGASRPVALGSIAAEAGMDPLDLARLVVYDEVAAGAAALLKLEPGDPLEASRRVIEICAEVDPLLYGIADLVLPEEIPAAGAPQSEAWAEAHVLTSRRLFRA